MRNLLTALEGDQQREGLESGADAAARSMGWSEGWGLGTVCVCGWGRWCCVSRAGAGVPEEEGQQRRRHRQQHAPGQHAPLPPPQVRPQFAAAPPRWRVGGACVSLLVAPPPPPPRPAACSHGQQVLELAVQVSHNHNLGSLGVCLHPAGSTSRQQAVGQRSGELRAALHGRSARTPASQANPNSCS